MRLRNLLLGSTALVGAGVLGVGAPSAASAVEVLPGGALNITLSGFGRFRVHGGQLDNQYNLGHVPGTAGTPATVVGGVVVPGTAAVPAQPGLTTGVDFSNDYEFHVLVSGKHDATGIEYGAHMEFEGDTNHTEQTDEEWLWLRGGFGEFRFGDDDGVVDDDSIGAYTIAANTGGLDGDVISQLSIGVVRPSNTDDSTKIKYHSPSFGGLQLGLSFTPNNAVLNSGVGNGDSLALRSVAVSDEVEGSLVYKGDFAGLGVQASVVGSWGHVANRALLNGKDTFWTAYGGFATTIFGFKLAAGGGDEDTGGLKRVYGNAGIGASYGPVNLSLTAGKVFSSTGYVADKPWMAVLGADVGLMPGLVAGAEVAYFNNDLPKAAQTAGGDTGVTWLADLRLAF
jgi:predicted porin